MDSLLFLCARRIIAQRSLPTLPPHPCPVLFQVAFLDRRPLVLQNLVATWPFTELNFQRLVGQCELLRIHTRVDCIQAIIQGVVMQLQRGLEESSLDSSLRVLNMTGLPAGSTISFSTEALAKACMEVSKHQQEFQRRRPKRHKGCSSDAMTVATQQPLVVDVHTDLSVNRESFEILRDALQVGAAGPLRLKCREFEGERISASQIVTLLESLDPSCLRRVDLRFNNLGLTGLLEILPHLSRFPELCSLKLQHSNVHLQHLTPELATRIRCVARQLGMLPRLRELNLRSSQLSWNLHKILCDLQAPLESLELASCSLVPADLDFLSQSFHAPALKRLDLSGHDFSQSQGLLEPLQHLLEETSASLLHLDLLECHMADSHLKALLPTLQRCSRLRFLGLYGNSLSTAMLKDLLQKTLELPDLHLVVYPFPVDCYKRVPPGPWWKLLVEDKELFAAAKAEFSQMLVNSGRTDLDWTCTPLDCRALDYFSL